MTINSIEELYELSLEELQGRNGSIIINYAGDSVQYMGRDVIGNCLQDWLPVWFQRRGINIIGNTHTQEFPDFTARFGDNSHDVEIKCWNYLATPAFDIANFNSFVLAVYANPRKINADYFVLGYKQNTHGFTVERIYLKKIWELTTSGTYPVRLQVKKGQPYAIRPFAFHRNPRQAFQNRRDFVFAVKQTIDLFPNVNFNFTSDEWYETVQRRFLAITGEVL